MKQAHHAVFPVERTGFHNRPDKYYDQSTSDCIDAGTEQNSDARIATQLRQHSQPDKAGSRKKRGSHHALPVTDAVAGSGAEQVHKQLCKEKCCGNECNLAKRYVVGLVESQNRARSKVCTDCL